MGDLKNKSEKASHTDLFNLKPYTPKELRELYGVSRITFNSWLKPFKNEIGEVIGRCYTVNQVRIITQKLGLPEILRY